MTMPPPQNPYGGQPPYGGPPRHGGQPQWGGQPSWGGQPPAGDAGGQFGGPPPWGPPPQQPQWGGPPPGPPPGKGGKGKWILGGLVVLLVVALAVTITILVTRPDSDGNSPAGPGDDQASEFASADDTGPVNIITEDPTCDAWGKISRQFASKLTQLDWVNRVDSVPRESWPPEQLQMYEAAVGAITTAADDTVKLVKLTPNRVMRELYEQFVAYARIFALSVPTYKPADNSYAVMVDNLGSGTSMICSAVAFDIVQAYTPLLPEMPEPTSVAAPQKGPDFTAFLQVSDPSCAEYDAVTKRFAEEVKEWREIDPKLSVDEWSPQQRAAIEAATPKMSAIADDLERLGAESQNAIFQDFAFLSAQYWRAFVLALPEYRNTDNYLSAAGTYIANTVLVACEAVN